MVYYMTGVAGTCFIPTRFLAHIEYRVSYRSDSLCSPSFQFVTSWQGLEEFKAALFLHPSPPLTSPLTTI